MPFRPLAIHRKNVKGVIYPLTAAVAKIYGVRADGAYPIGAFYTVNIDSNVWQPVNDIWYRPYNPRKIIDRIIAEDAINSFANSIQSGDELVLKSGKFINWEPIPITQAIGLPIPQCKF